MKVIKRNGKPVGYRATNILKAIRNAVKRTDEVDKLEELKDRIIESINDKLLRCGDEVNVEYIQDVVEKTLLDSGLINTAKEYIVYRAERNKNRQYFDLIKEKLTDPLVIDTVEKIRKRFNVSAEPWYNRLLSYYKEGANELDLLIKSAIDSTTSDKPEWDNIAGYLYYCKVIKITKENKVKEAVDKKYSQFVKFMMDKLLYNHKFSEYTDEELDSIYSYSVKNSLRSNFTYSSIDILYKRYLIKDNNNNVLESPRDMFLRIALHIALAEKKENRIQVAKNIYDEISTFRVTVATPTLSNAGKPKSQLSSCFIDTVEDSLEGIFNSLSEFAKVSKWGGGMGIYLGKVRALGSPIRGHKGASGGVIRWTKLFNDTAVSVDQLGNRAGACSITLDVWHKDIPEFLQVRTNNGDDRMKAHDIFPAVSIPDLFWRLIETDINSVWNLFCPYEVNLHMGFSLEDYWGDEWEHKYYLCVNNHKLPRREITVKDLLRLIIKSAVETGTPFIFNRDTVNRANPNKHLGMIYSSNLCVEIAQNMSPSTWLGQASDKNHVMTRVSAGDYVTCNLASVVVSRFAGWRTSGKIKAQLKNTITNVIRLLDNVIDTNDLPTPFAEISNRKYRAIGLGTSGYHHLLALEGIKWESDEHIEYANALYEFINQCAIEASSNLAKEKGSCLVFEGSDWDTGQYFIDRNYTSKEWTRIKGLVKEQGMRNGYLIAIAPTGSTSVIAGTTPGIDPIQSKFYLEEKKGIITPRVAPDLNGNTFWVYKESHTIDHTYTIRAAGARQRHIDQSQSLNLFITQQYTFRDIMNLYLLAWKEGVKTIYYIRSKSLEVEECVSCAS